MDSNKIAELILSWCHDFRADELSLDDIQDRIATLDVSGADLPETVQKRLLEAQREIDTIRWGMCEAGQRAEVARVLAELERLLGRGPAK